MEKCHSRPPFIGFFVILTILILILGCADITEAGACWIKRLQNGKCKEIFSRNITKEDCCKPGNDDFAFTDKDLSEAEYFLATAIGDGTSCLSCIDSCDTFKCSPGKRCVLRHGHPKCICAPICKAASKEKRKLRLQMQSYHQHMQKHKNDLHQFHEPREVQAKDAIFSLPDESLLLPTTSQKSDIRLINVRHHDKEKLLNFNEDLYPKRDKRMVFYGINREFGDQKSTPSASLPQILGNENKINTPKTLTEKNENLHIYETNRNNQNHNNQNSLLYYPSKKHLSSNKSLLLSVSEDNSQNVDSEIVDLEGIENVNDDINEEIIKSRRTNSSSELLQNQRFQSTKNNNKFINFREDFNNYSKEYNESFHYIKKKPNNDRHPLNNHYTIKNKNHFKNSNQRSRHHKPKNIESIQTFKPGNHNLNYKQESLTKKQRVIIKAHINDDYGIDHYSQFKTNDRSFKLDKLEKSTNSDNKQIYNRNPIEKFTVNFSSNEFYIKNRDNYNRSIRKNLDIENRSNSNRRIIKQHHNNKKQLLKTQKRGKNLESHSRLSTLKIWNGDQLIESVDQDKSEFVNKENSHYEKETRNMKMLDSTYTNKTITTSEFKLKRYTNKRQKAQFSLNHQPKQNFRHHKSSNNQFQVMNISNNDFNNIHIQAITPSSSASWFKNNRSSHNYQQQQIKTGMTLDEKIRNDYFSNGFSYPQVGEQKLEYVNPVCGTDGRTYRSECQLKKRACRQDSTILTVAYRGYCQTSCKNVRCQNNLTCVEDQYGLPHCIKCSILCPNEDISSKNKPIQVCGYDGQTYNSVCHLSRQICLTGRSVGVAYNGACVVGSTCETVSCGPKRTCLKDLATNQPKCVTCSFKCPRKKSKIQVQNEKYGHMKICGNNNHTYHSWCHMRRDSCNTDLYIDIKHVGACHKDSFLPILQSIESKDENKTQ